ncbi:MAG TPA: site-specific DNA-methyltransferase [Spirochaetota bacterium]|nr:site-specific DNA-methyltransferase [Spirochaetota bacterium]
MYNNINYKEIILSSDKNLTNNDINAIKILNQYFKKEEIQLEIDANRLIVLLKEIDLVELKNKIENIIFYCDTKNIFYDIISSIENIKSYGLNGTKRNYVDYNKERKVKDRILKEEKRGQYYYAKDSNFSKINNELPKEYINKIICNDSYEELKKLPDNCIDIIFTSPPYNFGLEYNQNQDDYYWKDYFNNLFKILSECIRILKYGGRILINIQPLFSDYIPTHHIISNFFISNKMIWKGEIIWEKNNYNCKYTAWGSWKSPSNPYLKYTWEFIEVFCKGTLKKEGDFNNIDISAEEFKQSVIAKWSIAPERDMKEYGHPAMFPEKLVEKALKLFSYKNDVVLDPFNGVGTTTYVAKKLGRRYIGIDISKDYCNKAIARLNKLKEELGLFANE